jgi:ketosteroid isomerase-like protein
VDGVTREQLAAAPAAYFEAVDRKDMAATLAFFRDDATFTVQTAGLTFTGKDEIEGMFTTFFADYEVIRHGVTNLVVDEAAAKAATEQTCPHVRADGTPETVVTCNVFEFAPDGHFRRVIVWIDGVSPLK